MIHVRMTFEQKVRDRKEMEVVRIMSDNRFSQWVVYNQMCLCWNDQM